MSLWVKMAFFQNNFWVSVWEGQVTVMATFIRLLYVELYLPHITYSPISWITMSHWAFHLYSQSSSQASGSLTLVRYAQETLAASLLRSLASNRDRFFFLQPSAQIIGRNNALSAVLINLKGYFLKPFQEDIIFYYLILHILGLG